MRDLLLPLAVAAILLYLVDRAAIPAINPYYVTILYLAGFNIIMAVSLNVINGFTGQFSLGHAGFMAIGAYGAATITFYRIGLMRHALGAMPDSIADSLILLAVTGVGGLSAALAGVLIGLPTLRLRGDYLAIATLGFGEIIRIIFNNTEALGGGRGLPNLPHLTTFFWTYLLVVFTVLVVRNYTRSAHGRALLAIREDEIAAEMTGINTTRYKVAAFLIGSFFAGVAGGLFAHYNTYISPNSFDFMQSVGFVIMVILGGMGSITGSVIAALVLTALPQVLSPLTGLMEKWHLSGDPKMVIYSLLLIAMMLTRPRGLMADKELSWEGIIKLVCRRRHANAGA